MTAPTPGSATPVGEDDLQAFVDGRLPPERREMVERYLSEHPEAAARLEDYARHEALLASSLQAKFEEPIPNRLRIANIEARRRHRFTVTMARAAAILLIVGLSGAGGWIARTWTEQGDHLQAVTQNAFAAYATFSPEVSHPVEVRADGSGQLVQWLSKRLQRPLVPPDLATLGFRLMGGRVLPTAHAPAAQLMYDDDHGTRLTIYIQPMGIDGEEFRYTKQGDVRTIYWAERRMALAVTGRASNERLLAVARSVHDQMDVADRP
jgi:anti-sigma factor RsiW